MVSDDTLHSGLHAVLQSCMIVNSSSRVVDHRLSKLLASLEPTTTTISQRFLLCTHTVTASQHTQLNGQHVSPEQRLQQLVIGSQRSSLASVPGSIGWHKPHLANLGRLQLHYHPLRLAAQRPPRPLPHLQYIEGIAFLSDVHNTCIWQANASSEDVKFQI